MRKEVARMIADIGMLESTEELTDDERRLLQEAKTRLMDVFEGGDRDVARSD